MTGAAATAAEAAMVAEAATAAEAAMVKVLGSLSYNFCYVVDSQIFPITHLIMVAVTLNNNIINED